MEDPKEPYVVALCGSYAAARDPRYEVTWEPLDAENPRNWPLWYRVLIVASMSFSTTIVVIYSTMYTSGVDGIRREFNVSSQIVLLGLTTNLFGLALGSVVLSSLSEIYGRRPIYIISVLLFALFILPVALAENIETILISRFFGGFFGGTMIASAPGSVTDVTDDQYRALALSFWSLGTMNGPVLGTFTPTGESAGYVDH
ncbi:hypothetical protein N7467_006890 [Penicillium canescens]|nr:hypothetical protein N7467_006890 [Penicillium canescens]